MPKMNKALGPRPRSANALVSQGAVVVGGSRQDFRQYLDKEVDRWSTVFKTVKISL